MLVLVVAAAALATWSAGTSAAPTTSTTSTPSDVPATAWYHDGVVAALDAGALRTFTDGTFRPRLRVARLQFAAALWRVDGRPTPSGTTGVVDVAPDSPHRRAVDWVTSNGLLDLTADSRFRPHDALTRAALVRALWRRAGAPTGSPALHFVDVADGARYARAAAWAIDTGVLRPPRDDRFRPSGPVTRAQLAAALFPPARPDRRPNVVEILTDDQTLESMRVMPNVQRLIADEGTTFSNAVATFPLCCPARATLLTGQYAHNTGVRNNVLPLGGYATLDHTNTLATWLHDAGYVTAHVGKYMNCYGSTDQRCGTAGPEVPSGWDRWFGLVDPYPANLGYMSFDVLDDGALRHVGPAPDVYQTDVLADRAVADIEDLSRGERPFFVSVWTQAPHSGIGPTAPNNQSPAPSPRYAGSAAGEELPNTPSFGEPDVADKPSYVRGWFADHWGTNERYGLTRSYRATLESLRSVDDLVGEVVGALAETGALEQTVIVFTSDNGLTFGEHRMKWWKVVPYEESIHVPLVIRGPGFPAGATAQQVVGNIDIAPTLVDLAQATPRRTMDGRSLVALAQDPDVAADRAVLVENWPDGTSQVVPHYDGVRAQGWVYLEYGNGERELYDLRADPYQLTNRADDPALADQQAELASALDRLRGCIGPACEATVTMP